MKKQKDFHSIGKIKIYNNKLFRISTISILLIICLLLIYYFHFVLKTEIIFFHFFYIPIVLSSLWWAYKGTLIAVFLSAILLILHVVTPLHTSPYKGLTRILMFLTVSIIISFLIEKRQILEYNLRAYGKNLEQKIYEWEETYKKLAKSANKPIILIGLKGKLLLLNNRAALNFGGKPKDYISKTLWDIFPKKVADERFKDHQKVIQSGRSNVKEITVSFKGEEYYYLARIQPVRNKSGDINSVLILDKDITDRKKTEKYLAESEEKYRTLFKNTGTATMIIEEDKTISMTNTQGVKLSGYSKSEIENKMKWTDFIIPEDLERMEKYHIARRRAGEKPPTEYEFSMMDKKGNVKNVFLKIGMVPDTKKSIASLMDITERKQAENKVEHLNLVLRAIRNVNQLIVREKDRDKLIKGACENLTKTRGYHNAWIVLLDEEGKLKTCAEAGLGKDFLPMIELLKSGKLTTCSRKALKQQEAVIIEDPASTCAECPLAQKYSGRAGFAIRLEHSGKVCGLMTVSISAHLADDQEEQSLFEEVAGDIAFALYNIELDKERKQAESELQIERDKLTAIFESMADGVYIVNKDYDIQYVNPVLKRTFGSPEGKKCHKYFHDSDEPCTFCKNEEVFAGKTVHWEWTSPKVGKTYDLIDTPIKNADGSISKLEIFRDITKRKQAEEDLKKNEQFLNSIFESVQDGVSVLNLDLTIRHVNGIMNKWYKENLPLEGKKCYEVYHNADNPCDPCPTLRCLESGKTEWNIVPGLPGSPAEWIELYSYPIKDYNSGKITGVVEFVRDITERKQAEERLKKTMDASIGTMSRIIEAKDPYTSGHQHRVCQLAVPLARELGLTEDKIEGIRIASLIHDIGKIGLPTEILSKPSKLTDIEFSLIKGHSQIGYDILKSIDFTYPIAQIVLQHHERLNGSGYPNNLKGDEILLEARILGVADVVEAMSSFRPYRPALGIDVALEEIIQNRGTLYDPEVVDACLKLFKEKGFKFKEGIYK